MEAARVAYARAKRLLHGQLSGATELLSWRLGAFRKPSFSRYYHMERAVYQRALELTGRSWAELWGWETKLGGRALADSVGVPAPSLLHLISDHESIPWGELPSEFVLKTNRGWSARGVYVLRRQGGLFVDYLRARRLISAEEIVRELNEARELGLVSPSPMLVEEALFQDDIPTTSWLVYAFYGDIQIVRRVERDRVRGVWNGYFDADGQSLGDIYPGGRRYDATLGGPADSRELHELAKKLSIAVRIPFVRVDLLEFENRFWFGELTPMPGSSRFRRDLDVRLGRAWEQAAARLITIDP